MYIKIPEGYDEVINKDVDKKESLILQKAIYGLVQAARHNFGRNLLTRCKKEVFSSAKLIHACCTKKMRRGICIIISLH